MTQFEPQLSLRPQTDRDALQLALWLTDPAAEWRQWDAPYLHQTPSELIEDDRNECLIWLGECPIGLVTRSPELPLTGGWWELGILIYDPQYWSCGLGTRALHTWTQLTFEETSAHLLTLTTWSGNTRMIRAAERLGYQECARVREARLWQGVRYDSMRLQVLRSDWQAAH